MSCNNEELQQVRKDGYLAIRRDCDAEKVPSNFTRAFLRALRITLDQASFPRNETVQSPQTALRTQEKIGFYNMVVGFLSTHWTLALDKLGVKETIERGGPQLRGPPAVLHFTPTFGICETVRVPE